MLRRSRCSRCIRQGCAKEDKRVKELKGKRREDGIQGRPRASSHFMDAGDGGSLPHALLNKKEIASCWDIQRKVMCSLTFVYNKGHFACV